jgi:hypothetical protein
MYFWGIKSIIYEKDELPLLLYLIQIFDCYLGSDLLNLFVACDQIWNTKLPAVDDLGQLKSCFAKWKEHIVSINVS